MREFFRPFRRTLGVLTLMVTCRFMALWVRSHSVVDLVTSPSIAGLHVLIFSYPEGIDPGLTFEEPVTLLRSAAATSYLGIWYAYPHAGAQTEGPRIPHWSIVIPLTMLSAWLLLSKPRPTRPS